MVNKSVNEVAIAAMTELKTKGLKNINKLELQGKISCNSVSVLLHRTSGDDNVCMLIRQTEMYN